jgi:hypothetical protein
MIKFPCMSIVFAGDWLQHSHDHLTNELLAKRIIQSAADALANAATGGILLWCNAAHDGADILKVHKELHQPQGPLGDLQHLTMSLNIPLQAYEQKLTRNTFYNGKFHLFTTVTAGRARYQLQPTELTFRTSDKTYARTHFDSFAIANARVLDSTLTIP